jgi:DNA-binding protein HU-beta
MMYRHEFIEAVSQAASIDKRIVERVINATLEALADVLVKGEEVRFANFGSFKVKERPARKGRNLRTGEEVDIAAGRAVLFKPAKTLKDRLNG